MINISADDWQQGAFRVWMRTGVWPNTPPAGLFSRKYNHWHDAEDGRFAFAGSGRHDGTSEASTRGRIMGGGGYTGRWDEPGGFGGGGASGSWQGSTTRSLGSRSIPSPIQPAPSNPAIGAVLSQPNRTAPASKPDQLVMRNGYAFRIDAAKRTRRVSGELTGGSQPRSRSVQARAGVPDRLPTDDGGHYIAPRFNGPAEAFNHFAQDSNFNRGRYRAIEDEWAKAKRTGMKVTVKIVPYYDGSSRRPSEIDIYWNAAGWAKSVKIPNRRQEAPRVRR